MHIWMSTLCGDGNECLWSLINYFIQEYGGEMSDESETVESATNNQHTLSM